MKITPVEKMLNNAVKAGAYIEAAQSPFAAYKDLNGADNNNAAPFETYLFISLDGGHRKEAYCIHNGQPLDLDYLLEKAFPDFEIETTPENGGQNYAAIITDGRPPYSPVVWSSCNFYLSEGV